MNAQQSIEEILAREWVAIALQIRQMRSDDSEKQQMQDILGAVEAFDCADDFQIAL